jgi:hypothetical protein
MTTNSWERFFVAAAWIVIGAFQAVETFAAEDSTVNFDDVTQGQLPRGWTIDATNPGGALAEWSVVTDPNAPSKPKVLTLKTVHDTSGSVFNLCWTRDIAFEDGEIEVRVRANTGKEDRAAELFGVPRMPTTITSPATIRSKTISGSTTSRTAAASSSPAPGASVSRRANGSSSRSSSTETKSRVI